MPTFGSYETVKELRSGGHTSVFSALRRGEERSSPVACKACRPPSDILDGAAIHSVITRFQEQSRDLEAISASSDHWCRFQTRGEIPGGAYRVTELAEHSLAWVVGKTSVDGSALYHVVRSVVAGLCDLDSSSGRPHGNLTPANILVCGTKRLDSCRVVLSDLLPVSEVRADRDSLSDLRAIGTLIYELATGRPYAGGVPDEPGEEWACLGSKGEQWRELCCELVGRGYTLTGHLSVSELRHRVASLRPSRRGRWACLGGVVLAVIATVVGLLVHEPAQDGDVSLFSLTSWQRWCNANYDWLGQLRRDVAQPARRRRWLEDKSLRAVLDRLDAFEDGEQSLDPREAIGQPGTLFSAITDNPPPIARSPDVVNATRHALQAIDDIQEGLSVAGWPRLRLLHETGARAFSERGWRTAAAYVAEIAEEVTPSPSLAQAVDRVLVLSEDVSATEAAWQKLLQTEAELTQTGSRVLSRFGAFIEAAARPPAHEASGAGSLTALRERLSEIGRVAAKLHETVTRDWPKIDAERFLAEEEGLFGLKDDQAPTHGVFNRWLSAVKRYYRDPPAQWLPRVRAENDVAVSEVVNIAWRKGRDHLLLGASVADLDSDSNRYSELLEQVGQLRTVLVAIDDEDAFPPSLPKGTPLSAMIQPEVARFGEELRGLLGVAREHALSQVLKQSLDGSMIRPTGTQDLKQDSAWLSARDAYRGRWRELGDFRDAGRFLGQAFAKWATLSAGSADSPESIESVFSAWDEEPIADRPEVAPFWGAVRGRVEALRRVASATSASDLLAIATSEPVPPHVLLSAYCRLGDLEGDIWPTSESDSERDGAIAKRLVAALPSVGGPERRAVLRRRVRFLERRRQLISKARQVGNSTDPILAALVPFVDTATLSAAKEAEAGQSALFDDSEALVADLLKAVTSPVWRGGRVAGDVFAAEGVAYRAFDGRATADTFRQWLVELPSYEKLVPDPRGSRSEMTRRLDACAQDIVQIREVDAEVQAIPAGELAALDERAAQLGAVVEDTWGPPGVVKYADTIKERHTRVVKRFDALEGQLKVLWEKVESPTDWVARVKGQLFPGTSPSLSAAWLERREALLVGVHAGRLQADPSQYAALRAKVRRTYRLLEQLDGAEALSSGLPEVGEDLADARRDRAVAAALQRRRDDTLKGVLNDLDWRKGAPLPLFAEYAADTKWHARCEGFAEERRVLLRCRGDVAVATKRLESVYSPGEKGKDGRTVLELMAPWKDHPLRGDVDVGSMLIPLLERVSRLHDVSTSADRAHLAALMTAGATDLGTRLVAWNRLGRITSRPWPATVAELDTAARVSTELSQRIRSTVPEPDRQKELAARITKQLRSGWFACLPLMRDQEALSKALREHSTFGVLADDVAEGLLDGERKHGWLVLCAGAAPDVMPGLVRRCWELLAKSGPPEWPAGIPDLVSETRISARLAELQPQQRRQVLAESLTRWQRCFNRLRSPSMLDQAFAVLEVIAVDVGGLAATGPALGPLQVPNVMSPHARFNLILGQLRRRCVRGTIPDLDDARALRLRDGVVQAIQRLGAGLADETVLGTFVPQLQGIVADPQAASRTLDLEDAGPGAVGWQVVAVGDDRRAVTYAQTFGERRQELAFLRVEPDVGEPAFLCIEELSLGLFSDVLSSRTDWKADGFIADTVAEDLRQGPRVWELVGGGDRPRFVPAKTWLTPVPIDRPYYPESVSAGRPAWEHPVQYVSADFARPFSRMLGCRPPTVKEWQAARRTTGDGDVNRRDVTWSRQKQHIDRLSAEGFIVVEYPDAGMFVDAEATGPDATTTVGSDDGVLWFRKAAHSSSAVFVGLLGNVAEYVLVAAGRPPSAAPEELTEIAVIGGSALWPPGVSEEAPQTNLDPDLGFADVGLRLAFTAPPESCAGQLARIVRRQSYSFPVQR